MDRTVRRGEEFQPEQDDPRTGKAFPAQAESEDVLPEEPGRQIKREPDFLEPEPEERAEEPGHPKKKSVRAGSEGARQKETRRDMIRRLIAKEHISTQNELTQRLLEAGFSVTQATVSRDIRELRLVKIADGNGRYHYEMGQSAARDAFPGTFYSLFHGSVRAVDYAQNILVIHTYSGMAQAVCATMDSMEWPDVVGTLAGEDTIIVILRTEKAAEQLTERLQGML